MKPMKYVSEFTLKAGTQLEYKRRHDELWPEMAALIKEADICNYSIWNIGTKLIEYFETDNIERAHQVLSESNIKQRWDEYMSDILVFNEKGEKTQLRLMFELN